jgi:hypothetical protein
VDKLTLVVLPIDGERTLSLGTLFRIHHVSK